MDGQYFTKTLITGPYDALFFHKYKNVDLIYSMYFFFYVLGQVLCNYVTESERGTTLSCMYESVQMKYEGFKKNNFELRLHFLVKILQI